MATAHSMLALLFRMAILAATAAALSACTNRMVLERPITLSTPYPEPQVIWAVAPLTNESGVGVLDELAVTDALISQITQVEGLTALPLNRSIEALRALGIPDVRTPDEARALARALGADAIVVGSITAWYPYDPPRLGMNLALYARTGVMQLSDVDPVMLSQATTDSQITPGRTGAPPVTAIAGHFDASNHDVVADMRRYAAGRHDPRTAAGNEIYLRSMEHYTQFVCFRLVEDLLSSERQRLTLADATP